MLDEISDLVIAVLRQFYHFVVGQCMWSVVGGCTRFLYFGDLWCKGFWGLLVCVDYCTCLSILLVMCLVLIVPCAIDSIVLLRLHFGTFDFMLEHWVSAGLLVA